MPRTPSPELQKLMDDFIMDFPKRPKPTEATHDKWTDDNGVDWWVHRWNKGCTEDGCAIHAPTDHNMAEWPQVMSMGTLVVRICKHNVEHPDPDSLAFFERRGQEHMGVHACDGCCNHRPKPRVGQTVSIPAVKYSPGVIHKAHDCEICRER